MSIRITIEQLEIMLKHLKLYSAHEIIFEGKRDAQIQEGIDNFSTKPENTYQHDAPKGLQ